MRAAPSHRCSSATKQLRVQKQWQRRAFIFPAETCTLSFCWPSAVRGEADQQSKGKMGGPSSDDQRMVVAPSVRDWDGVRLRAQVNQKVLDVYVDNKTHQEPDNNCAFTKPPVYFRTDKPGSPTLLLHLNHFFIVQESK